MATRLPTSARNAAANAITALVDAGTGAGTVQLRTGSQPATANDAASGTLLATFVLSDPAFGAASAGVSTLDVTPLPSDAADATGTAGWARALDSAGATVIDGSVTASGGGGDFIIDNTSIVAAQTVNLTAWTITVPAG